MARSTRRTIRNTPTPMARDLLRFANNADTLSRRAKSLAAKVVIVEKDAEALLAMLDSTKERLAANERAADVSTCDDCGAEVGESGVGCPDGAYVCGHCFESGAH